MAFATLSSYAQLADGSTAPNFTFKDTKGNLIDLYTILNDGKYVVLDVSATWCGPCWNVHNVQKTLKNHYNAHDVPGDNTSRVLFVEGDVATTLADLQGTGSYTQGDWLTGTNYPVMNPTSTPQTGETSYSSFDNGYQIGFYPTFFVICPNKKVWQDTLNDQNAPWPSVATFEWINNNKCNAPNGLDVWEDSKPITLYPNPATNNIKAYFSLQTASSLTAVVTNAAGQQVQAINFGKLTAGDQVVTINTTDLSNGFYNIAFKLENGRSISKKIVVAH
jgi:hypothetical protein